MGIGTFGGMYLRDVIGVLKEHDPDKMVKVGFLYAHSWRGAYSELAVEPVEHVYVRDMLGTLTRAVGETFTGWKGGEFRMSMGCEVHLAHPGGTGEPLTARVLDYMLRDVVE